ncbi:MAG: Aspartyl-tRNA synthetase [candidate division WWE3 bacterium GW2011_GWA2_46_9]|uniref:Aspartyl-tRNA synthetase n=1 Tax=candidate division WWE3 bacterium GW2011_GWA2_46_9 TaxID=1619111 RepID=A0A0G1QW98_UNCKA|nr:MAG: Aspartyl-tRNA synthetase [candidate division WWE3 bacterium GW2011_GWA2_46_9]
MERTLAKQVTGKIGEKVLLLGWVDKVRDHGKLKFVDLRDRSGIVQCVFSAAMSGDAVFSAEDVVEFVGDVKSRPEAMVNSNLDTGAFEVSVEKYSVLNPSKVLPIPIDTDGHEISEELRLKYRYLDLKRARMQRILRLRSEFTKAVRQNLHNLDFVEIETPILTKSTKEGARDFIVPSRYYPGRFFALPQSPQQYKQLLMTAGVERYFQIAKCIRDEDPRADRGYEFTQIDVEMSFVNRDEVMAAMEGVIKDSVTSVDGKLQNADFPVFTYKEALAKFGADKFDLRTDEEKKENVLAFAWVVDFPFFKKVDIKDAAEVLDGKSGWTFTHNPFSMPKEEHLKRHLSGDRVDDILTTQYDLVCNGYEVGGGSIRAHRPEILRATFKIMGYSDAEVEQAVGHMLEAFAFGTPPHGGIAFGLDRLVVLLSGEKSVKEAIAFPMTSTGRTSVMDAPAAVDDSLLKELGITVSKK